MAGSQKRRGGKRAARAARAAKGPTPSKEPVEPSEPKETSEPKEPEEAEVSEDEEDTYRPDPEEIAEIRDLITSTQDKMIDFEEKFRRIIERASNTLGNENYRRRRRRMNGKRPRKPPTEPELFDLEPASTEEDDDDDVDEGETDSEIQDEDSYIEDERERERERILDQLEVLIKKTEIMQQGLSQRIESMESMSKTPIKRMWTQIFG